MYILCSSDVGFVVKSGCQCMQTIRISALARPKDWFHRPTKPTNKREKAQQLCVPILLWSLTLCVNVKLTSHILVLCNGILQHFMFIVIFMSYFILYSRIYICA